MKFALDDIILEMPQNVTLNTICPKILMVINLGFMNNLGIIWLNSI